MTFYARSAAALAVVGMIGAIGAKLGGRRVAVASATVLAPNEIVATVPPIAVQAEAGDFEPAHVLVASDPSDAHVLANGTDVGSPPLTIDVPSGHMTTLEIFREGFRPQVITLDGSEKKLSVKLVRMPAIASKVSTGRGTQVTHGAQTGSRRTASTHASMPGGLDLVNPWAK